MDAVQLSFRMRKEDSTPFSSKLLTHLDINKAPKKKIKIQTVNVNVLERELEPGRSIFTHCRWKQRDLKQQDGGGKKKGGESRSGRRPRNRRKEVEQKAERCFKLIYIKR